MEIENNNKEAPAMSPGRSVFLSSASQDVGTATSVCQYLESHGVSCWLAPRDVKPGAPYAAAIVQAINDVNTLVLILSASSVESEHVSREIERAASKHKQIIAYRIDSASLSPELEYFLSKSQWIDVTTSGMPAALEKLKEAVTERSESSPPKDPWLRAEVRPVGNRPAGIAKRVVIAAAAVIGVGVTVVLGLHFWPPKHGVEQAPTAPVITEKSIAVLPFVDMSEKHDQEYFADGTAEEILDLLAKIPAIKVVGRTSSFQFKGKNEDLRTIGTQLGAAYVLEGSVRKSSDRVRVTAQLIGTRDGVHLWSETYDRQIDDVLKLQDAIALAVVRELQLSVAPEYLQPRSSVKNVDAYDLLLRGRHAADRWNQQGFEEAVTLFQQALERDPTFADAAAELAFAYEAQGEEGYLKPAGAFEQARGAATTALRLNPLSVRAHYVTGLIHVIYDWDWAAGAREFEQVERLSPGSADPLIGKEILSLAFGHWDEALQNINAALARDPLRATSFYDLAEVQMRRGRLPEAEAAMRRGLDIRPTYEWGQWLLGLVLLARGEHDAALSEMQRVTLDDGREVGLAMAYFALGRKAESDAALAVLLKDHADDDSFEIANVYALRGQRDEAIHWLERAYAQREAGLIYVKVELPLKNIETDSRYKALLRKMNLPE